jgi:hypothetical protein
MATELASTAPYQRSTRTALAVLDAVGSELARGAVRC